MIVERAQPSTEAHCHSPQQAGVTRRPREKNKKEEKNKQINKCIQYTIEYKTVQDEVSAFYNCTWTTFSITTILSFLIRFIMWQPQ